MKYRRTFWYVACLGLTGEIFLIKSGKIVNFGIFSHFTEEVLEIWEKLMESATGMVEKTAANILSGRSLDMVGYSWRYGHLKKI